MKTLYIDTTLRVVVAKNKFGDLVCNHLHEDNTFDLDFDDRDIIDEYDLTDDEARYNKKIRNLLEHNKTTDDKTDKGTN